MKEAVTFGRYNTFSYAHISTIIAILKQYNNLTIGLIINQQKNDRDIKEELYRIYELADKNYTDKKLLPVGIRKEMMIAGIKQFDLRLLDKVNIEIIRRPEYFREEFNSKFPKTKYDVIFPRTDDEKNEFDILRNMYMQEILGRDIYFVKPKLTIHNSDMEGQREKYMPSDVLRILDEYNKMNSRWKKDYLYAE